MGRARRKQRNARYGDGANDHADADIVKPAEFRRRDPMQIGESIRVGTALSQDFQLSALLERAPINGQIMDALEESLDVRHPRGACPPRLPPESSSGYPPR